MVNRRGRERVRVLSALAINITLHCWSKHGDLNQLLSILLGFVSICQKHIALFAVITSCYEPESISYTRHCTTPELYNFLRRSYCHQICWFTVTKILQKVLRCFFVPLVTHLISCHLWLSHNSTDGLIYSLNQWWGLHRQFWSGHKNKCLWKL